MGTMIFLLPPQLEGEALEELECASVAGGQEHMPYATQVLLDDGQMILHRSVDESGSLQAPWQVSGAGQLMVSSGTLMERLQPYQFLLELARGKVNQLRGQTSDWLLDGLLLPEGVAGQIRQAVLAFGQAMSHCPSPDSLAHAQQALVLAHQASDALVEAYLVQMFQARHARQQRLDAFLGCRLGADVPVEALGRTLQEVFTGVQVPFAWGDIEPTEAEFDWRRADALVEGALSLDCDVIGGPLVDFSGRGLPDWLWEKETDLPTLNVYLGNYAQQVVRRYQGKIRTWQVTAGSNHTGVLAVGDEELLWLTVRLVETIRRIDSSLELIAGISQPWGDYLASQERNQSPFVFADTLLRTGIRVAALDLELILGVSPRGSYCRDPLEVSRLLDLYAKLGMPLQVTLGYPSAPSKEGLADPDLRAGAGHWRSGFSPEVQAEWAAAFAGLCLCKPYVRSIVWCHFADNQAHQFPHCGLVDAQGQVKPALQQLAALRAQHLQ